MYVSTVVSSIYLVHVEIDIKMDLTLLDLTLWKSNQWLKHLRPAAFPAEF